jgi:O-glycosyl hydrolase
MKKLMTAALAAATIASAASITVDPTATKQEIVGFGGGSVYYQNWITALADKNRQALFDTAFTGLNLSLLRMGNWLQADTAKVSQGDITIVQAAKQRLGNHLKIEMSSWSAPGSLKPSGSVNGNDGSSSADNSLKKVSGDAYGSYAYTDFAAWWKKSLETYKAAGITPDYISIQNEPDMNAEYEETLFTPTETDTAAGYKQALNAVYDAVKGSTKILGPEPLGIGYSNFEKYVKELDDNKLDGYAYHLYHAGDGNDNSGNNYLAPENFRKSMKAIGSTYGGKGKPIIMTEFCNMLNKTREEDMVGLAHIMQVGFTDGQLAGYIAWQLFWGEGNGQLIGVCAKGWGSCKNDSIVIGPEYHAMRHYSKFVNPGWKAISATTSESALKTVGFANNSGDSVTVVVVNTGKVAISLDAPTISGMNVAAAVQSKEKGFKSKNITIAGCYMLPARSVTTLVFTKTAAASTVATCKDETTDPNYSEPVITPSADVVIIDYSKTTDVSTWQAISDDLGAVTYNSGALDGVTGYVSVPLAGCEQADCGYKSQLLNISEEGAAALANCTELVITMRSQDKSNAYVNVGGANGGSWVDYQYGRTASASTWSETTVDLEKEGENGSTALTFNSDASGIYIAKIVATGCTTTGLAKMPKFTANDHLAPAKVFDLNGNLVWSGLKGAALNADGTLRLELRQGMYIVKTSASTVKALKK